MLGISAMDAGRPALPDGLRGVGLDTVSGAAHSAEIGIQADLDSQIHGQARPSLEFVVEAVDLLS